MNQIRAVTLRNLDQQGFDGLNDVTKTRQAWPLRFTPAVSVSLILIGLSLQSPWWLAGMALVALSGALLPGGMLIDTLYNIGVRHLFHAPPLPPSPKPRQFSYLISTGFLTASAVLFYAGLPVLGSVVGGLVAIAGTVLATTHWCLGSFFYRLTLRARTERPNIGPPSEAGANVEPKSKAPADSLQERSHLNHLPPPASTTSRTASTEPAAAPPLGVNITGAVASVDVLHHGRKVTIRRNQDQDNVINPEFAKTSRKCPPFCIEPAELAPGVKTIAELEVLQLLGRVATGDASILVIDSRTSTWVENGTIPGTVNVPWDSLNLEKSEPSVVQAVLVEQFGVRQRAAFWDFEHAKTLLLFCNGPWCGQSSTMIGELLKIGYPAHKLLWYRGGMQDWESLGLSVLKQSGTLRGS